MPKPKQISLEGRSDDVRIDVSAGLLREQVVLRVSVHDRDRNDHSLETLLTTLEARRLGHAVLDALGQADRDWPISIEPSRAHDPHRRFEVCRSTRPRVVLTAWIKRQKDGEQSFAMPLDDREARRLGHALLAAANPSRLASEDD